MAGADADDKKHRRSLSTVTGGGAIELEGDRELARALGHALDTRRKRPRDLTHEFHTYPARMHPDTAARLLELVLSRRPGRRDRTPVLLDPFCGSGTVVVEAMRKPVRALGVDANPIAVAVAAAKTWTAPSHRRRQLVDLAREIAADVVEQGKAARRAGGGPGHKRADAGPAGASRQRKLARWFAPHVRRELEALAAAVDRVRRDDAELGDRLTAVLSSILYKVSRRESETSRARVDRAVGRGAAARLFARRASALVDGLQQLARGGARPAVIALGDARDLDRVPVPAGQVDAVVTSPPYGGTYDYAAHQDLRAAFLGVSLDQFARREIGARRTFDSGRNQFAPALEQLQRDTAGWLVAMAEVLRPRAHAALVVGDSLAAGRRLCARRLIEQCLPPSLQLSAWARQRRQPLGSRELRVFSRDGKWEYALLLTRR